MKFTAQDLSTAIQFLRSTLRSSDNFHTYSQSPIHKIVYKELNSLSRKEIESYATTRSQESIKDSILDIRNPYLFYFYEIFYHTIYHKIQPLIQ